MSVMIVAEKSLQGSEVVMEIPQHFCERREYPEADQDSPKKAQVHTDWYSIR